MSRFVLCLLLAASTAQAQQNWPRFRGPNGQGVADSAGIPSVWNDASTLWRVKLAGGGHGSPVVWGGHVYLLTSNEADMSLVCHDTRTGAELWRADHLGKPVHRHALNASASGTPAVDARGVYFSWADGEGFYLAAYTHQGDELWKKSLGRYESSHGYSRSPIVAGDLVILASNQQSGSFVAAFDPHRGSQVWRTPLPSGKAAYDTPCVIETPNGRQAIVTCSSEGAMHAVDAVTGEIVWAMPDVFPQRCVGSPIAVGGLLLASSGSGGGGKQLVAVRPPQELGESPRIEYAIAKAAPYVPTPLALGDLLVLWHERGTVAGFDLATGEKLWEQRIGGKCFASPIAVSGLLLNLTMDGEAIFLSANRQGCKVVARNDLGEPTEATPAVAAGRLFISTEGSLICVGAPNTVQETVIRR